MEMCRAAMPRGNAFAQAIGDISGQGGPPSQRVAGERAGGMRSDRLGGSVR